MDRFRAGLDMAYSGNQLSCSYLLTHVSGVGVTSVNVQGPATKDGWSWGPDDPNVLMPSPPKLTSPSAKQSRSQTPNRACR